MYLFDEIPHVCDTLSLETKQHRCCCWLNQTDTRQSSSSTTVTWWIDCHGNWSVFLSLERMHRQRAVLRRWVQLNIWNNLFVLAVLFQKVPFVAGQNVACHLHHKGKYGHAPYSYSPLTIDVTPALLSEFTKHYSLLSGLKSSSFTKLLSPHVVFTVKLWGGTQLIKEGTTHDWLWKEGLFVFDHFLFY